jgi:hypothetical protein
MSDRTIECEATGAASGAATGAGIGAAATAGTGEAGARAVAPWAKSAAGANAAAIASETNRYLMVFLDFGGVMESYDIERNRRAAPPKIDYVQ